MAASLFIISCERDEIVEDIPNDPFGGFIIKSHKSANYTFDEQILQKVSDAKSQLSVRQKSFYDDVNNFYIDDFKFNHLKVGD